MLSQQAENMDTAAFVTEPIFCYGIAVDNTIYSAAYLETGSQEVHRRQAK
jgi:hypothetical protein